MQRVSFIIALVTTVAIGALPAVAEHVHGDGAKDQTLTAAWDETESVPNSEIARPAGVPDSEIHTLIEFLPPVPRPAAYQEASCQACGDGMVPFCVPRLTARFDYLMWWSRGRQTPPLLTTSPTGTPRDDAGEVGLATTTVLYGDEPIGTDMRSGGRVTLSYLLGNGCAWADGRFWGLEESSETFFASSAGDPILTRPFFNVVLNQQDALLLAFPGVATDGSILVQSQNEMSGADAWLRQPWCRDGCARIDLLAGYQYTRMADSLVINSVFTSIDPAGNVPPGTVIDNLDSFATRNEFHGGQLGFLGEYRGECWTLEILGKIALGGMRERVVIDGRTILTEPGDPPVTSAGGLLAQPTNIGAFERSRVAFVPEVGVNLAYHVSPCWQLSFGYSFLYWSDVMLAGRQIDPVVNLSQNPGPIAGEERPRFVFDRTHYWVQGMNFGAEYRW